MVTILPEKKELASERRTVLASTRFSHFTVKKPFQQSLGSGKKAKCIQKMMYFWFIFLVKSW